MPDDYTEPQRPAIPETGDPIVFRPSTFQKHARAFGRVEQRNSARYPRVGRGRTTRPALGIWGYLASGHTISAASGLTLGSGTVTLCSRSGSSLTADGDDVEVYNSGQAITGPKALELDWVDGEWAVCECGALDCGSCCVTCSPCALPKADLTLVINGTTTTILVWDVGTINWSDGTHELACSGGNVALTGGGTWTNTAHTCNPIGLTFTSGGDTAVITGPAYGATTWCQTFSLVGCCGFPLPNATVNVYNSLGGTLLASGLTGTDGKVSLAWAGPSTVYVTATEPSGRFAAYGHHYPDPVWAAAGTTSFAMLPATGYHCAGFCLYPAKDTLTFTGPGGSCTLEYGIRVVGEWTGCYSPTLASSASFDEFCDPVEASVATPVEIRLTPACLEHPGVEAWFFHATGISTDVVTSIGASCSGGLISNSYSGPCSANLGETWNDNVFFDGVRSTVTCPLSFSISGELNNGSGLAPGLSGAFIITE